MIRVDVPGLQHYMFEHLVLDLNGTVALDGQVCPGIAERLEALAPTLAIHLVTADTCGQAWTIAEQLELHLTRIEARDEVGQKRALVERLGKGCVVAIGNGANDAGMLAAAALSIAVLGPEGLAVTALRAADLVVGCVEDGLDLLLYPQRLVATLRR